MPTSTFLGKLKYSSPAAHPEDQWIYWICLQCMGEALLQEHG